MRAILATVSALALAACATGPCPTGSPFASSTG